MGKVADFERELLRNSPPQFATWHAIDLHNHSTASFDYKTGGDDYLDRLTSRIHSCGLSAVMFTDHEVLPASDFIDELQRRTGKLILAGVELNVFVDAWLKEEKQVDKFLYFHLLVGFDPTSQYSPEYWLQHVYNKCVEDTRTLDDGRRIRGVTAQTSAICEVLKDANAIVIPAHLHSTANAFKSRSIDRIYRDPEFLKAAQAATCLEVLDPKTADYFDGKHAETNNLHKACIRSSDSHSPEELGWRPCYAQMQKPSYAELKQALELPFRVRLERPSLPPAYIAGVHIKGRFFPDLWLSLSPNCNVFMGVKGSGKTSVLECIRYVLGVDVPESRKEDVMKHLEAILGPGGTVTVLLKRSDGAKVLVERTNGSDTFSVTLEDGDETYSFKFPDGLQFPANVLGWHEIEKAATDARIRRVYLDAISGRDAVRRYDDEIKSNSQQLRSKHELAASKLSLFQEALSQVRRLRERREGLRRLEDSNLLRLRTEYEAAMKHRDLVESTASQLNTIKVGFPHSIEGVLDGIDSVGFEGESPLTRCIQPVKEAIEQLEASGARAREAVEAAVDAATAAVESAKSPTSQEFAQFATRYQEEFRKLPPEQQELLESHRRVMEETKQLPALESQLSHHRTETESIVRELLTPT